MEKEYIILAIARLGLLLFSFFALTHCILMIKAAWQKNDQKKMRKEVSLISYSLPVYLQTPVTNITRVRVYWK
jgi:hypothetical protein